MSVARHPPQPQAADPKISGRRNEAAMPKGKSSSSPQLLLLLLSLSLSIIIIIIDSRKGEHDEPQLQ
jgi:hypothetical protein